MRLLGLILTFMLFFVLGGDLTIFLMPSACLIVAGATVWGFFAAAGKRILQLGPLLVKEILRAHPDKARMICLTV